MNFAQGALDDLEIGLMLDDVVLPTSSVVLAYFNDLYGTEYTFEDLHRHGGDFLRLYPMEPTEWQTAMLVSFYSDWGQTLEAFPGLQESLNSLYIAGAGVTVFHNRPGGHLEWSHVQVDALRSQGILPPYTPLAPSRQISISMNDRLVDDVLCARVNLIIDSAPNRLRRLRTHVKTVLFTNDGHYPWAGKGEAPDSFTMSNWNPDTVELMIRSVRHSFGLVHF